MQTRERPSSDYEDDFYKGTTGNKKADEFFDDALDEYHAYLQSQSSDEDERLKSYSINHLPNADDDELVTHDFEDWQKCVTLFAVCRPTDKYFIARFTTPLDALMRNGTMLAIC
jgi:hypothetical protein